MTYRIVGLLLFVLFQSADVVAQKDLGEMQSYVVDSSGNIIRTLEPVQLTVNYKSKGKSKIYVHVAGQVVDSYEIVDVKITQAYISLLLFCETENFILTTMRFYLHEQKLETITTSRYSIFTTGSGLKYHISKRVKGTKKILPAEYIVPPM